MDTDEAVWNDLRKRHARILGDVRIDCGVGWRDLLDALCSDLQRETDLHGATQAQARQIKEKLGQMRFHAFGLSQTQLDLIAAAVEASGQLCERCGRPADTAQHVPGRIQNLCSAHRFYQNKHFLE
jgi:hypothetical protein